LEEIAFQKKWISSDQLENSALNYGNSQYGKYLRDILIENL